MRTLVKDSFGTTVEGIAVDRYTLTSGAVELQCLTYGGIISRLVVPDRTGTAGEVALGFETLGQYERDSPYFGAIVGRYANRLAGACVAVDGVRHRLAANEGPHHLHGGHRGFDKRVWDARPVRRGSDIGIVLSRTSDAGEEGYPGALRVQVRYFLTKEQRLVIDFSAVTTATSVVNLTQHTYFNLSGDPTTSVADQRLTVIASRYLPVDRDLIPTGELAPVKDTPFDFLLPRLIGERLGDPDVQLQHGRGYDHTWVLDGRDDPDLPVAELSDPRSGRRLAVSTSEPGLQVYSGNRLNVTCQPSGRHYGAHSGICLEAQHFPDSPAHPQFPSTLLRAGERFESRTVWSFSAD